MYNRLLFYCPQMHIDVIFAAGLKSMSPETVVGKTLPALNVAAEGLIEARKEAFFDKALTATGLQISRFTR